MGNTADSRAECTRSSIRESLLDVLQTKTYDKITVSEICSRSGISRGTFYNHYGNLGEALNDLIEDALGGDSVPKYCRLSDERYECPYGICDIVREQPRYAPLLLDPTLSERIISAVWARCRDRYVRDVVTQCDLSPNQADIIFLFQLNGCLAMNRVMSDHDPGEWKKASDLVGRFIVGGLSSFSEHP